MSDKPTEEAPKKKKGKLPIIIIAAVLLLGGGGAAGWFFLKKPHDAESAEHAEAEEPKPKAKARKVAKTEPPTFVSIDPFTFNLQDKEQDRFAQIAVVLEVEEPPVEAELKTVAPSVRNALLMLMSSKTSEELLSIRGKQELSEQVVEAANAILAGERPPRIERSRRPRGREGERSRDIATAGDHGASGAKDGKSGGSHDAPDDHARDDRRDDRDDDRYDDRYRRPMYPERVVAAHFSQFIIQ